VPATIKKIAQRLKINPSTVSRALSGSNQVSEATRNEVLKVAREMDYSPNLWAQNLVGAAHNIVGCLVRNLDNPFYIPMLRAIEDIAAPNKYLVFMSESRHDINLEKEIVERFRRMRVAGAIIAPVLNEISHLQKMEEDGVPIVVVARDIDQFDSINLDNLKSGELAGEYLLSLNHADIGFIHSGNAFNIPEQQRLQGLINVLKNAGLGVHPTYQVGSNSINGGESAIALWKSDPHPPTAVFCDNDLLAMGFIQQAIKEGVRIPEDVSVVSHDDIPFADSFTVPITTIAFPKYELGSEAINLLIQRLKAEPQAHRPTRILLKPKLIERQSCQPFTTIELKK
jgi:DNA-binding LacI/PurR family transcriptional regulator